MKYIALSSLFISLLSGCDALESSSDKAAKEVLMGSWYVEFKDPSERQIKYLVNLGVSRAFTARQRMQGEPSEESSSGVWHVTEGLFKLQTNEIAGKKLGSLDSFYLTRKLGPLKGNEFSCEQGSNKLRLTFRRVQSDFKIQ